MNVKYTDRIKQLGEGYSLVQQATERLEEIVGPASGMLSAEWDRTVDEKGRDLLTIQLEDFSGRARGNFSPDELKSSAQMSFRMHRLWGDLLQFRLEKQLEKVLAAGGGA